MDQRSSNHSDSQLTFVYPNMNYKQIIILNVLSSVQPQYTDTILIHRLNNFFDFDHNIFIIDSSAEVCHFVESSNHNVPKTLFLFETLAELSGVKTFGKLKEIKSKNSLLIVVIESDAVYHDSNFQIRFIKICRLQRNMKILFFISRQFATVDDLHGLFRLCYNNGIANMMIATFLRQPIASPLNIFKFNAFVEPSLINITDDTEFVKRVFPNRSINFELRPLRFLNPDSDGNCQQSFTSIAAVKLQDIFCRVLNASASVAETLHDSDCISILDTSPARVAISQFVNLYPIATDNFVIVVPEVLPYAQFGTYIQNSSSHKLFPWNLSVTLVTIILLSFIRLKLHKRSDILQSALDVVNVMASNNEAIKYKRLSRSEVALLVPLTFAGILITNGYMSTLQSFLIQPKAPPQIERMEELYQSKVIILLSPTHSEPEIRGILNGQSKHNDWSDRIRAVDHLTIDRHIHSRNSSIAFIALEKEAKILLAYQKRMSVAGYYIPAEGMALRKMLKMSYVNDNFPFIECLNDISGWLHSAGLYKKWDEDAMHCASKSVEMDVSKNFKCGGDIMTVAIIIYGWIVSGTAFALEIFWEKFSTWRRSNVANSM